MRLYKTGAFRAAVKAYYKLARRFPITPRQAKVEAEKLCNLRCVGCRRHLNGNISKQPGPKHLTPEILRWILDMVPLRVVRFAGDGEPLVNPHFNDLLRVLRRRGIKVAYTTNGVLLDRETAEETAACGAVNVSVSFTGARRETFERLRTGAKFYEVVDNLGNLKRYGIPFMINYLLLNDDVVDETLEAVEIAKDAGANAVLFLKPMFSDEGDRPPDMAKAQDVLAEARARLGDAGILCTGNTSAGPMFRECYEPFVTPLITLGGEVFACQYMANQREREIYAGDIIDFPAHNYIMGNINGQPFAHIWRNGIYSELRRVHRATAYPDGAALTTGELRGMRQDIDGRFGYCRSCLYRWGEAGG